MDQTCQYAQGCDPDRLPFTGSSTWELVALVAFGVVAITVALLIRYSEARR